MSFLFFREKKLSFHLIVNYDQIHQFSWILVDSGDGAQK